MSEFEHIVWQRVAEAQRCTVTADQFGIHFPLQLEPTIFALAANLSSDYVGGYWDFYTLASGGFFMAPDSDGRFQVVSPNGWEGFMSADALGITAFLVKRDDAGFSVGKREHKLGIRASSTCELLMDRCFVPAGRVLGEVGKGYKIAIETLNEGRIGIGAQMVGVGQGALDAARRYALEREQFGKKIAEFQGIQFLLADCATRLEAARLLVYNAARLKEGGRPFVREAAIAKLFASEAAEKIAASALEVFGGYGYTIDYPAEKYYRDAKIGKIYEGTSFMQLQTIAKLLLSE